MKTLKVIFLTFFKQQVLLIITAVFALIFWVIGTFVTLIPSPPQPGKEIPNWAAYLVALCLITFVSSYNFRQLIISHVGALLPHYRRKLLAALGVLLLVFVLLPSIMVSFKGYPLFKFFALYVTIFTGILWIGFTFGEYPIFMFMMLWWGKLAYDLLGFHTEKQIFKPLSHLEVAGVALTVPLLFIVGSFLLLYLFARYFLWVPADKLPASNRRLSGTYANQYDAEDRLTRAIVKWRLKHHIEKFNREKERKNMTVPIAGLIQYSLFSPSTTMGIQMVFGVISLGLAFSSYVLVLGRTEFVKMDSIPFLILIYLLSSAIMAADFLQHRHRMPGIKMQAMLDSREQFARAVTLSYIMVAVKQWLGITVCLLLFPVIFKPVTLTRLLPVFAAGLVLNLIIIALSLLTSKHVLSADARGWTLTTILVGGYGTLFLLAASKFQLDNNPETWYFIMGIAAVALLMLWGGYRKMIDTEMNFIGPNTLSLT